MIILQASDTMQDRKSRNRAKPELSWYFSHIWASV